MSQCDTYDEQQEKSSGMLCFVDTPVVTYLDVREDLPRVGLVCVQWYLQTRSSNNVEGLWLSVNPLRASQLRGSEFNGPFISELLKRRKPQFRVSWSLRRSVYRSILLQCVARKNREDFDALAELPNCKYDDAISRDIHRTHPGRQELPSVLFKVLRAIANKHPSMGYCQGINFVAAHLWLIHGDLAATFYVLDGLLADYRFRMIDMYMPTLPRLRIMTYQLDRLVEAFLPGLNRLMEVYKVGAKFYATQWFMTVFSYDLGPCDVETSRAKLLLDIWDRFVCDGWSVVMKAAVAFLKVAEETLLAVETEEEFLRSLRTLCGRINSKDCARVEDLIDFGFRSLNESALDQLALDVTCGRFSEVTLAEDGELRIRQGYPEVEHARYKAGPGRASLSFINTFRIWLPWNWGEVGDEHLSLKSEDIRDDSESSTNSFSEYVIP